MKVACYQQAIIISVDEHNMTGNPGLSVEF